MAFHKFLRATITDEAITLYGDGDQTRDFTFISDAVNANVLAAAQGIPGRVYNIGGGAPLSGNAAIAVIPPVTRRTPPGNAESPQTRDIPHTSAAASPC